MRRNLKTGYEAAHSAWRISHAAWAAQHRKIENDRSLDRPGREAELSALGNAPIEPIKPLLRLPSLQLKRSLNTGRFCPARLASSALKAAR